MNGPLTDSDNALLRAWRRGELDEASRHAFEMRLFLEPTLLEAAQLDQGFEAGLRQGLPVAANDPGIGRPRRWTLLAAAAVGALAVLPFLHMTPPGEPLRGNVEWVTVDVRRSSGASEPMLVEPRAATGVVAMELPAPAGAGPYRARLRGIDGSQAMLDVTGLHAADGVLSLAFARDALPAGTYLIEIRGGGATDELVAAPLSFRYRPQ
jgi:hypothetical protein